MKEIWKPVPGMEDKYSASTLGRIKNTITGEILRYGYNKGGYRTVSLYYAGRSCGSLAHLIIAKTFHGPRPAGMHTRHLDTNKDNNKPSNLKYGTVLENVMDSYQKGIFKNPPLTERKRKVIRVLLRAGMPQVRIASRVGVPAQSVCRENKSLLKEQRVYPVIRT